MITIYAVMKYTNIDSRTREVRTIRRFKNREKAEEMAYGLNEKAKDNEYYHVEAFCE